MNKLLLLTLLASTFFSNTSAQGWETVNVVDDFGDKVGERIAFIGEGLFSNSATDNSEMNVRVSLKPQKAEDLAHLESIETYTKYYDKLTKEWEASLRAFAMKPKQLKQNYAIDIESSKNKLGSISFELFEYKSTRATFMKQYHSTTLRIKLEDGSNIDYSEPENKYSKTSKYWVIECMKGTDSEKVWNAFNDDKSIRCIIVHNNSKYIFSVDGYFATK